MSSVPAHVARRARQTVIPQVLVVRGIRLPSLADGEVGALLGKWSVTHEATLNRTERALLPVHQLPGQPWRVGARVHGGTPVLELHRMTGRALLRSERGLEVGPGSRRISLRGNRPDPVFLHEVLERTEDAVVGVPDGPCSHRPGHVVIGPGGILQASLRGFTSTAACRDTRQSGDRKDDSRSGDSLPGRGIDVVHLIAEPKAPRSGSFRRGEVSRPTAPRAAPAGCARIACGCAGP
jgi:hypothetical protein